MDKTKVFSFTLKRVAVFTLCQFLSANQWQIIFGNMIKRAVEKSSNLPIDNFQTFSIPQYWISTNFEVGKYIFIALGTIVFKFVHSLVSQRVIGNTGMIYIVHLERNYSTSHFDISRNKPK